MHVLHAGSGSHGSEGKQKEKVLQRVQSLGRAVWVAGLAGWLAGLPACLPGRLVAHPR
jgi:hypothetical protein